MIVEFAVAGAVAIMAYGARLLTAGGAIAATAVGAASMVGGAGWVVPLLFFFASSSALSRWRGAERERLLGAIIEKGNRRDAIQVLANGAVFAIAAALSTLGDVGTWQAVGAGAIAAATADTWSTEIGTVLGGSPRLIFSGRRVPPGTSGGVTIPGSIAGIAASILAAFVVSRLDWVVPVYSVVAGGIAGSLVDSVIGATMQERRWCATCAVETERRTHSCGTPTGHRGGIRGCNNDFVNLMSTIAGGVVTWTLT
jgi:uncharacterized protein (TIGR00297 family)